MSASRHLSTSGAFRRTRFHLSPLLTASVHADGCPKWIPKLAERVARPRIRVRATRLPYGVRRLMSRGNAVRSNDSRQLDAHQTTQPIQRSEEPLEGAAVWILMTIGFEAITNEFEVLAGRSRANLHRVEAGPNGRGQRPETKSAVGRGREPVAHQDDTTHRDSLPTSPALSSKPFKRRGPSRRKLVGVKPDRENTTPALFGSGTNWAMSFSLDAVLRADKEIAFPATALDPTAGANEAARSRADA